MYKYKNVVCGNCGEKGHTFKICQKPKISLGVVAFKHNKGKINYLMIMRKNSHGFVEFMRGKYNLNNEKLLERLFDEMTINEKKKIISSEFKTLWKELWIKTDVKSQSKRQLMEFIKSEKKFNKLKKGYVNKNRKVNLNTYIDDSITNWKEPEWGFPKGRRNIRENDLNCAIREFKEETGINFGEFHIYTELNTFSETFVGSNNIKYRSIYYIGKIITNRELRIEKYNYEQISEIGDLGFFSFEKCLEKIRPYNFEKKKILSKIHNTIKNNKLHKLI